MYMMQHFVKLFYDYPLVWYCSGLFYVRDMVCLFGLWNKLLQPA